MSSYTRNVLDIRKSAKPALSRVRAQTRMAPLFSAPKQPRLKARRRKQRLIALLVVVLVLSLLVLGLAYASRAERFQVSDISIAGAERTPESDIRSLTDTILSEEWFSLFSKRNIFLYPQEHIEAILYQQFPRVEFVQISRTSLMAQALNITVRERESFALWCGRGSCFFMDDEGFIFAEGNDVLSGYLFRGGLFPDTPPIGQRFLQGRFDPMRTFLEILTAEGFPPREITIENDKDFSVTLEPGFTAVFSFEGADTAAVRNLKNALQSEALEGRQGELVSLDLRFGNKVYYTFENQSESVQNESGDL